MEHEDNKSNQQPVTEEPKLDRAALKRAEAIENQIQFEEEQAVRPTAPVDRGLLLARIPRVYTREELRFTWDSYNGRSFLAIRVWKANKKTGDWYPNGDRFATVRVKELDALAAAVAQAQELARAEMALPQTAEQAQGEGERS